MSAGQAPLERETACPSVNAPFQSAALKIVPSIELFASASSLRPKLIRSIDVGVVLVVLVPAFAMSPFSIILRSVADAAMMVTLKATP